MTVQWCSLAWPSYVLCHLWNTERYRDQDWRNASRVRVRVRFPATEKPKALTYLSWVTFMENEDWSLKRCGTCTELPLSQSCFKLPKVGRFMVWCHLWSPFPQHSPPKKKQGWRRNSSQKVPGCGTWRGGGEKELSQVYTWTANELSFISLVW